MHWACDQCVGCCSNVFWYSVLVLIYSTCGCACHWRWVEVEWLGYCAFFCLLAFSYTVQTCRFMRVKDIKGISQWGTQSSQIWSGWRLFLAVCSFPNGENELIWPGLWSNRVCAVFMDLGSSAGVPWSSSQVQSINWCSNREIPLDLINYNSPECIKNYITAAALQNCRT